MPKPTKVSMDFSSTVLDIMDHLQWSYGSHRGYAVLGLLNYEKDKPLSQHMFAWPTDKDEISSFVSKHVGAEWTEIFYCPLLRKTTERSLGNATHYDILWADVDKGMPEALHQKLRSWGARIVFSGSPGSYHIYLKLTTNLSKDRHRACERALREMIGADNKIADNDFLKVPGSWNYKNHPSVPESRRIPEPVMSTVLDGGIPVENISEYLSINGEEEQPEGRRQDTWDGKVKEFRKLPDIIRQLQAEQSQGDGSGRYRRAYNAVRLVAEQRNPDGTFRFTLDDCHSILNDYEPGVDKFGKRTGGWHEQLSKIWYDWEAEQKALLTMEDAADTLMWNRTETLRHIYTCALLGRVSPWAVLGVVLARVITRIPHNVIFGGSGTKSLNLYVGLVGSSGAGKGSATSVAESAIDLGHVDTVELGTGAGIVAAYKKYLRKEDRMVWDRRSTLFMAPEVTTWAARISRPDDPLLGWLCQAWSGESVGGKLKSTDLDMRLEPNTYRLCLVMGIQPEVSETLFKHASNGTPQRWLWLPAGQEPGKSRDLPSPLIWTEPDWPFEERQWGRQKLYDCRVVFPESCEDEIQEWKDARIRRMNAGQSVDPLAAHEMLMRRKVTVGLMALEGRTEVSEEDWELSGYILGKSNARRKLAQQELKEMDNAKSRSGAVRRGQAKSYEKLAEKVTDERLEKEQRKKRRQLMAKKIVGAVRKTPGITKRELTHKVHDAELMNEVLQELIQRDVLSVKNDPYRNRPRLRYFYGSSVSGG